MEFVSEERVAPRGIGKKEGPLRRDSEFLHSVRTQLATVLDALRHCVCHKISMARDAISQRLTLSRNKQFF